MISVSSVISLAAENQKKPEAPRRENLLEKYDKNKNGKLDPEEREAVRKDREADRLKRFDKNGDGKLDKEEQEAARSELRKRRGGQDAPGKQEEKKKE
jgi:Ca2+-binding EF-hand superfamily protein